MTLYTVATPIGNLSDITFRAVEILKKVDLIVAEDTRHAGILMRKYNIQTYLESFHAHSGPAKLEKLIEMLRSGKDLALISDAGTPGISDPGFVLIRAAREEGTQVIPIPGPSAFLAALQASGLPTDKFLYLGFLPLKKGRQKLLAELAEEDRTVVFYESPHRILKTLSQIAEIMEDRYITVARELTKIYEEFLSGTAEEILDHFKEKKPKGEFVIILAPKNFKKQK
ncbi:MAG: 16S rRNA (cytidine(1402)-2'-O)-methyltransferase [Patescibacteria group bacterium]|nr:16S rRNA (cytidine(1402)-2'-O)-methyltransferase [Patescibacteria group bacterium]